MFHLYTTVYVKIVMLMETHSLMIVYINVIVFPIFFFLAHVVRGSYEDLRDSGLAFTLTTLLHIIFSICIVIPISEVLYVTYLLQIVTRGFMSAVAVAGIPIL